MYHNKFPIKTKSAYVHKAQDGTVALTPPALKHEVVGSEAVDEMLTTSTFFLESVDGEGESWRDLHGFSDWMTFHPCSTKSTQSITQRRQTMFQHSEYSR